MEVNRVFICHAIRSENRQELQKLYALMRSLRNAGLEIVTEPDDNSAEHFFPLLQQKLLTCQAFILWQTADAVSAPRVILAVRVAQRLAKQKRMYIFRFVHSQETEGATLQEWKALTTFNGTHDYLQASEKLVRAIAENAQKRIITGDTTSRVTSPALPRVSLLKMPAQKTTERPQTLPSYTSGTQSQMRPSVAPRTTIEVSPKSAQGMTSGTPPTDLDKTSTASDRKHLNLFNLKSLESFSMFRPLPPRGERNVLMLTLIPLVILLIIGSAGILFFLSGTKSTSATPIARGAEKSTSSTPNQIVGQAFFIGSGQIGTDYNTGICDEIQVDLNHLTPPAAGQSYYAWLLPDGQLSAQNPATLLGRLTVKNGTASMIYANPTHENLLLTKSRLLITEESSSSSPSAPSSDQHTRRYTAALPQSPSSQDHHYSDLDHIRHLLAQDPTLQQLGMQGGLSTWFYENVKSVLEWADLAQAADDDENFRVVRSNVISMLDYLDGTNFVADDVPAETPIAADPQIARVPILSLAPDPASQNPPGYIQHIEYHLQGLTNSPGATDAQRTLASKIAAELDTINGLLEQVRQDAKQLVNMSNTQLATPVAASLLTDLVANANSAFVGQLDPTTNTRQGGATWVHDVLPQLATLNVEKASSKEYALFGEIENVKGTGEM